MQMHRAAQSGRPMIQIQLFPVPCLEDELEQQTAAEAGVEQVRLLKQG